MKELKTQEYLRSGKTLKNLKEEFGIKSSTYEDLVVLNYSQTDSPKTNEIVMECRSLILQLNTWDVVSMAFRRFFNKGEVPEITEKIDYKNAVAQEKIDGSIVSVFYHNNKWLMSTRGSIEGQGQVGFSNKTFRELFYQIIGDEKDAFFNALNKNIIYIFELTSLDNKVVKVYKEHKLCLIGMRETDNFYELKEEIDFEYKKLKQFDFIRRPQVYPFNKFEELLKLHENMEATDEGFVVVNYNQKDSYGNFMRVKVKNPAYVALAHMKESGGASLRCILQLIILGEEDEFINYFPEFKNICKPIKDKYDEYVSKIAEDVESVQQLLKDNVDRKTYAMTVKSMTFPPLMFSILDSKFNNFSEYIINIKEKNNLKAFTKNILKILKIKDISFEYDN